jgi:hypothetical protein
MTDRKKLGVAFWATVVVVVVLIGYPLSFGPACWIASRSEKKDIPTFYWPIQTYVPSCPGGATVIAWYAKLFLPTESFGVLVPFNDRDGKLSRVRYHADPPPGIDPGQL